MHRIHKLTFTFVACAILFFVSPTDSIGDPIPDPINDTFGTGPAQLDVTSINAVASPVDLTFFVFFASPISPPSAGVSNSLGGFIDIDTDQNPNTGDTPFINVFGPGPFMVLGQDFFLDLFSEADHPGLVDVHKTLPDSILGTAGIMFTSTSFSVAVPLALLGADDGLVNYDVVIGTSLEATDVAPDGSTPATSQVVPEPATIWLLGVGFIAMAVIRVWSRTGLAGI